MFYNKDIKQVNKGSLKLVFSIYFPQIKSTFRDFKLMSGTRGDWISSPSREYQDAEGKKKYYNYFVVDDSNKDGFQAKCLELLKPHLQASGPSVFDAPATAPGVYQPKTPMPDAGPIVDEEIPW